MIGQTQEATTNDSQAIIPFSAFCAPFLRYPTHSISPRQGHPALHLMNDSEFVIFLKRLIRMYFARSAIEKNEYEIPPLNLGVQENEELARSYTRCLQSLDNTREEIQKAIPETDAQNSTYSS